MKNLIYISVLACLCVMFSKTRDVIATAYIGLFADDCHISWCVTGEDFYPVEMWVWFLPSENGLICYEMGVDYPSNVIQSTFRVNDSVVSPCVGCTKYALCFMSCQWDWVWPWHQTLYVTDSEKSVLEITVHPQWGTLSFYNCEDGYPAEPCTVYTNLYINYIPSDPECQATSVEGRSWGAIKTLLK
jgi:hypothetical protein